MKHIIHVEPNAHTTMLLTVDAAELTIYAVAARNSRLDLYIELVNNACSSIRVVTHLVEPDSQIHVKGFYCGSNDSEFSCATQQLHAADRTESSVLFKSLLADRSRFVYKGLINVDKGCNAVKAVQVNKNSLFSREARCISIPSLQVQSKNVSCTHASATGPFDKELIWFAESRGISKESAYRLMMNAFVADVVLPDRVENVVQAYAANIKLDAI